MFETRNEKIALETLTGRRKTVYLTSYRKWMEDQGLRVKRGEILIVDTKDMKLWRTMIAYALKEYGTKKR